MKDFKLAVILGTAIALVAVSIALVISLTRDDPQAPLIKDDTPDKQMALAISTAWFRDYVESSTGLKLTKAKITANPVIEESTGNIILGVQIYINNGATLQFLVTLRKSWHVAGIPEIVSEG